MWRSRSCRPHTAGVVVTDAVGKVVWWSGCVLAEDDWFVLSVDEREDCSVGVDGAAKDAEVNNGSVALLSVHVAVGAADSGGGTNAAAGISASMSADTVETTGKISDASGNGKADDDDDAGKSTLTGCTAVAVATSRVLTGADEAI